MKSNNRANTMGAAARPIKRKGKTSGVGGRPKQKKKKMEEEERIAKPRREGGEKKKGKNQLCGLSH